MSEDLERLKQSLDRAFEKAETLNAVFEKSEKPHQRRVIEILHGHSLPAFIGPFFDAYFRIAAGGGDTEQISTLMIGKLSAYLGEDVAIVAQRHKAAVSDYVEYMSRDLGESGKASSCEEFMPAEG